MSKLTHIQRFRSSLLLLGLLISLGLQADTLSLRGSKKASTAPVAFPTKDGEIWKGLVDELFQRQMPYGAMTDAQRILSIFDQQDLKEKAYQTIVQLVDLGYPYSLLGNFLTGDLELPADSNFTNSYNLYKGMAALDRGMSKWADQYFNQVDKETFDKYFFFKAMEAYQKNDLDTAESYLQKLLNIPVTPQNFPLIRRASRTLARIYFEKKDYVKSYDIYDSFLIQLNPVEPNDWLETAWNLYYLKRYDLALGTLYNLESQAGGDRIDLEKYELRALIYQALCQNQYIERLYLTFDSDFGPAISGIKNGIALTKIDKLSHIHISGHEPYYELIAKLQKMREEQKKISSLPSQYRELANYLYRTEITTIEKKIPFYAEDTLRETADQLIEYSERLRFIKFETAKARIAPDEPAGTDLKAQPALPEDDARISWIQDGNYWRDERLHYRALVENRCFN